MRDKVRDFFVDHVYITFALFALLLWFIIACLDARAYNNGICPDCGGQYEYQESVGHRNDTTYIYRCNKCGKTIELETLQK